jgi:hypothetical protein
MVAIPIINLILTRIGNQSGNRNWRWTMPPLPEADAGPDQLPYASLEPD